MILKHDFLIKDARFTTSYHFRSIIPKDLIDYFNGRTSFTISLRTGIYRDARSISFLLYYILAKIVVSYRKMMDRKTHQPLSFRTISRRLMDEHNLVVSHNTVQRILDDIVLMKREQRNRKRRKIYS